MNFSIKQSTLMDHLNYVIKGISNKNLIPILNSIKFDLTDEGLYLMSTDNEIAIKSFIKSNQIEKIETLGSVVISGRYIYEIIRKLPNEVINIEEVVDSKLYIYTENTSFNLNCSKVEEFPNLDLEDHKHPVFLNKTTFKNIVNQTLFATSTQESRPVFTGLNFIIEGNLLEVTATDSYRLAKKVIHIENEVSEKVNLIIPTKNIQEINKLLNPDDDNLELHIFNNKVIFKFDSIIVMSRLINGAYPDTSKLIPTEFKVSIDLSYNDLYHAIDRASLLTNEADKNTIKFEGTKDDVKVSSNIPEIGNVEEHVSISNFTGEKIKIAFSSKYMMEALKSLQGDKIQLMFNGEDKPIILKDPEDESITQLILPIRID